MPEPPGGKGVVPPLNNPGPDSCPCVWASRSEGFKESFCTAVGKPGHERGGTAHAGVPVGWRKKYLGCLLCLAAATGDAAFVGPPPSCAAARDATPFDFTGAGAVVARSALNANAPAFYLPSHGLLADLAELDHGAAPQCSLAVARFEAHGGHAYLPLWYPSPSAPHVALPDASGCRLYGSDDAAVLALRGGPSREAARSPTPWAPPPRSSGASAPTWSASASSATPPAATARWRASSPRSRRPPAPPPAATPRCAPPRRAARAGRCGSPSAR